MIYQTPNFRSIFRS